MSPFVGVTYFTPRSTTRLRIQASRPKAAWLLLGPASFRQFPQPGEPPKRRKVAPDARSVGAAVAYEVVPPAARGIAYACEPAAHHASVPLGFRIEHPVLPKFLDVRAVDELVIVMHPHCKSAPATPRPCHHRLRHRAASPPNRGAFRRLPHFLPRTESPRRRRLPRRRAKRPFPRTPGPCRAACRRASAAGWRACRPAGRGS